MQYTIKAGNSHFSINESGGTVTRAPAVVDWMINCPFHHVRSYCERKGWTVVPMVENGPQVTTFDYKHRHYELAFDGRNITRITCDGEDITWQELPDVLKGLI